MALHNIDIESTLRRMADRRIEEAMEQGKFSNLQGMGQPLVLDEAPVDEKAKLMWWALRIMKQNDFTPEEVVWRKQIDVLRDKLARLTDETELPALVERINHLVHQVNTLGTNAINLPCVALDLESERVKYQGRLAHGRRESAT
jgi:hypothetical protein